MHKNLTLALASLLVAVPVAMADQSVSLKAAADNTLFSPAGEDELSNGAGGDIFAGALLRNAGLRRGLIRFDFDTIPPGAGITAVELRLTQTRNIGPDGPVSIHRALSDWGQGSSISSGGGGAIAQSGDATWVNRFYPGFPWTNAGGDFAPASVVTIQPGSISPALLSWSGPGLVEDVRQWIRNPEANFGWLIMGDEENNGTARRFASRENTNLSQRPALIVTFIPRCTPADVASLGGAIGADGLQTVDDLVAFLTAFFSDDLAIADLATLGGSPEPDAELTADDLLLFLAYFFGPCLP